MSDVTYLREALVAYLAARAAAEDAALNYTYAEKAYKEAEALATEAITAERDAKGAIRYTNDTQRKAAIHRALYGQNYYATTDAYQRARMAKTQADSQAEQAYETLKTERVILAYTTAALQRETIVNATSAAIEVDLDQVFQ